MTTRTYDSHVPYDWKTREKYLDLPFPVKEYESRLKRVRKAMTDANLDALLVFADSGDPGDLIYLTNFSSPFGRGALIVPMAGEISLITDSILHGEPINSLAWSTWVEDFIAVPRSPAEFGKAIARSMGKSRNRRVGLVGRDNIPMAVWTELEALHLDWVDFWFEFTSLKSVRSPREVSLLREVGRITADAMRAAVDSVSSGKTEYEIAAVANEALASGGSHDHAFSTIVNSGPRSGVKHSYPTDRKVRRGDMIYLDMGAIKYGYQSDMSRTVVVGGANRSQREVLDTIETAFNTLGAMMRPGVRTSEVASKAEEIASASGLREKYRGRIYLGLFVHHAIATSFFEVPSLGLADTILKKNMSFAFEPMAHILDFGTAVIEDCILITSSGTESLTPYEPVHW